MHILRLQSGDGICYNETRPGVYSPEYFTKIPFRFPLLFFSRLVAYLSLLQCLQSLPCFASEPFQTPDGSDAEDLHPCGCQFELSSVSTRSFNNIAILSRTVGGYVEILSGG